jgi:uncharacterized protein YjbI with pentapeptide repeats
MSLPAGSDIPHGPAYASAVTDGRRSTSERPRVPSPPDLPDVLSSTRDIPAELRAIEVREQHWVGSDLSGREATSLQLIESRLDEVDLPGAILRRVSVRDTVVDGGNWANADASEATLTRVEIRGLRLTGALFVGAKIKDATFVECRLDLSSFRFAELDGVRFENCRIEEADLYQATLTSIAFSTCDLTKASLAKATFHRSEMRDCELNGIGNPEQLRGVAMPWPDIVRSAAVLALGVGVRILDDD